MDGLAVQGFGLPTSTGDLPFDDHTTAVEFALLTQPTFPTIPWLRELDCSLIHQVASFIPGATVTDDGTLAVRADTPQAIIEQLDTTAIDDLSGPFSGISTFLEVVAERALLPEPDLTGVRIDILGPVTTALALRSGGFTMAEAMTIGAEIASLTGERILTHLRSGLGRTRIAVVMDEPALVGAMHPTFPLLSGDVRDLLTSVIDRIDAAERNGSPLLIGAHVPGRTDWSTVIASGVSLLSTPVGGNLEGCADHLQAFLDAGGMVAWGAVPVDEPLGATDEILWRRLSTFWCSLVGAGVDPFLVRAQSLISTSDGLGHFATNQVDHVSTLISSLSTRVHRQAAGTRLSLGA